jgi:hypothetical protein
MYSMRALFGLLWQTVALLTNIKIECVLKLHLCSHKRNSLAGPLVSSKCATLTLQSGMALAFIADI